ncbi:MAG TPA: glycosyltransferase, partial [Gaiellaceae bacterium]|nr:glycosyltransferase [Gaiellaceae bacterium]
MQTEVDSVAERGPKIVRSPLSARVSVIVPALNEQENLPHVLPRLPSWVYEVILVDDHCTDDTVGVARELLPTVRIVENTSAPGKGNAMAAGFAAATGDIV